jgi:hypothetical protein
MAEPMNRLLATIALLVALVAPAKVQQSNLPPNWPLTPQQMAILAAALAAYELNCDDLGPKNTARLAALGVTADRSLVTTAVLDVWNRQIEGEGVTAWCGRMKGRIEEGEHTPR